MKKNLPYLIIPFLLIFGLNYFKSKSYTDSYIENNDLNFLKDNIKKYENLLYPEVIRKYIWTFLFKEDKFLKDKKIQIDNVVFSY